MASLGQRSIQRRFSVLHRLFILEDAHGRELLALKSPLFHIWTFKLVRGDREVGRIAKRWGGVSDPAERVEGVQRA